jgi:small subunit ribosomal protein S17
MAKERRKVRVGRVVSDKMSQTAVVAVRWSQRHRLYKKNIRRLTKFYVHDVADQCKIGDLVRIQEIRPISRTKRWRLLEVLERREVPDVKPIDLDEGILSEEAQPGVAGVLAVEDLDDDDDGDLMAGLLDDLDEDEDEEETLAEDLLDESLADDTVLEGDEEKRV